MVLLPGHVKQRHSIGEGKRHADLNPNQVFMLRSTKLAQLLDVAIAPPGDLAG